MSQKKYLKKYLLRCREGCRLKVPRALGGWYQTLQIQIIGCIKHFRTTLIRISPWFSRQHTKIKSICLLGTSATWRSSLKAGARNTLGVNGDLRQTGNLFIKDIPRSYIKRNYSRLKINLFIERGIMGLTFHSVRSTRLIPRAAGLYYAR